MYILGLNSLISGIIHEHTLKKISIRIKIAPSININCDKNIGIAEVKMIHGWLVPIQVQVHAKGPSRIKDIFTYEITSHTFLTPYPSPYEI